MNFFRQHDPPKYQAGTTVSIYELPDELYFPLAGDSQSLFIRQCHERIVSICDEQLAKKTKVGRRGVLFTGAQGNGKVMHCDFVSFYCITLFIENALHADMVFDIFVVALCSPETNCGLREC